MKIQKFEYLENKESFLEEIKAFFIVFHSIEGLPIGEKQKFDKKLWKQALRNSYAKKYQ